VANPCEPDLAKANTGPSRNSVALVGVTLALLALLVWFLNPRQPNYKPAPLDPPSEVCPNPGRAFIPSNITEISDPKLDVLPHEEKNAAIFRLNMAPCSCGCNLSVAACHRSNEACVTSQKAFQKTVEEEGMKKDRAAKGK
jgi:hypothetical protein